MASPRLFSDLPLNPRRCDSVVGFRVTTAKDNTPLKTITVHSSTLRCTYSSVQSPWLCSRFLLCGIENTPCISQPLFLCILISVCVCGAWRPCSWMAERDSSHAIHHCQAVDRPATTPNLFVLVKYGVVCGGNLGAACTLPVILTCFYSFWWGAYCFS